MGVDEELEKIKRDLMKLSALSETEKPILVDFWAEWCAPCKMMAPIMHQLASELSGKALIAKLNVDLNPRTATQFGVMSIPNFIVFKGGKPVGQVVGAVGKSSLLQILQKHMV